MGKISRTSYMDGPLVFSSGHFGSEIKSVRPINPLWGLWYDLSERFQLLNIFGYGRDPHWPLRPWSDGSTSN